MPLIRFIGGAHPSDATDRIRLHPDEQGVDRFLVRGDPEFMEVSGEELRQIAAHYEVEIKSEEEQQETDSGAADAPVARPDLPHLGDRPSLSPLGSGPPPSPQPDPLKPSE